MRNSNNNNVEQCQQSDWTGGDVGSRQHSWSIEGIF